MAAGEASNERARLKAAGFWSLREIAALLMVTLLEESHEHCDVDVVAAAYERTYRSVAYRGSARALAHV